MTDTRKTWWQNNIVGIIVGCMVTAFFINWQIDRSNDRADSLAFQREIRELTRDHESRLLVLENIEILMNPNLDRFQKEALLLSARRRGGITNQKNDE